MYKIRKEITGDDGGGCGRPAIFSPQAPGVASSSPPIQLPAAHLLCVPSGGWLASCFPARARHKLLLRSMD